jgi:hypothetical protein
MSLSAHKMYPDVDVLMEQIEEFDLHRHMVELQAYGFTIVPPEKLRLPEGFTVRLRSAIIAACERRNSIQLGDLKTVEALAAAWFDHHVCWWRYGTGHYYRACLNLISGAVPVVLSRRHSINPG